MTCLPEFIDEFNFWDDGTQKDPTGSSSDPSAAYYMPKSAAQSQGLAWVNSQGHFGQRDTDIPFRVDIDVYHLRSLRGLNLHIQW
jgi:hypothetical protein